MHGLEQIIKDNTKEAEALRLKKLLLLAEKRQQREKKPYAKSW